MSDIQKSRAVGDQKSHEIGEKSSNSTSSKVRRKLLLGGAAGAALGVWHKPVINSIATPAHAQTTDTDLGPGPFFSAPQIGQNEGQNRSILDAIIPKAYAGSRYSVGSLYSQATPVGPNEYRIEIRNGRNTVARIGTLTVGVPGVLVPEGRTCRFDVIREPTNNGDRVISESVSGTSKDGSNKHLLDYLIPEAQAGMPIIPINGNLNGNMNGNANGNSLVEREADPWVCTILSATETEITLDIPSLSPDVGTIPAGDGMLPPLITDCEEVIGPV